jgi:hypothetical protein
LFFPSSPPIMIYTLCTIGIRDGKRIVKMPRVGVLWRPSFLYEGSRPPKKLDLQRTPQQKVMPYWQPCHFSSMLEVLHQISLGYSVNPSRQRTHFIANHIASFPQNSRLGALFHCSLNGPQLDICLLFEYFDKACS